MRCRIFDARNTRPVRRPALVRCHAVLSPHVHGRERDVVARRAVCADELDRRALRAVDDVSVPVLPQQVRELDARPGRRGLRAPVLVNVQPIGDTTADEVEKLHVLDVATPAIGLDHERLVAAVCVDIAVDDLRRCQQDLYHGMTRMLTFEIAVPAPRLPIAEPPDWLHQTRIIFSYMIIIEDARTYYARPGCSTRGF
jgi:hypothetical protein